MLKKLTILKQIKAMVPMRAATVFAHAATAFVPMAAVFVMATVLVSCADEGPGDLYADEETDMDFSVTAAWQPGRVLAATRSAEVPDIKDFVVIGDTVPYSVYPNSLWMEVNSDGGSYSFTYDDVEPTATQKAHPQHFIIARGDFKKPGVTDDAPTGWLDYHNQFLIKNYDVEEIESKVSPKPFYKKSEMKGFVINAFWPWKRKVDPATPVDFPATPTPFATVDGKLTKPRHWTDADVTSFSSNDFMYDYIVDAEAENRIEGHHLKLQMKHAMAMLRLHFCVDAEYANVRHIVLRKVKIVKVGDADVDYTFDINSRTSIDKTSGEAMPGFLLTTSPRFYACGYLKPVRADQPEAFQQFFATWTNAISTSTPITMQCTYDIYDKDILTGVDLADANAVATALAGDLSAHCTRRSVTATNTFKLGQFINSTSGGMQGTNISKLLAGHYYDLKITINPEYLYVLSQHDNKHITIN